MTSATLNGHRVTDARANIPAWGPWFAEASLDIEVVLTGRVELKVADLTLVGTVLSGGPSKGRSTYRIAAGAAGWGRTIERDSYVSDSGVKVVKVIGDAARLVGETFESTTKAKVGGGDDGKAWTRPAGPAHHVLDLLAPKAWYVGEDGVTRLGARTPGELPSKVTRISPVDPARRSVVLASESIATILPGVVVDGLTAVDVEHTISAKSGLRSTVWGARGGGSSRATDAIRRIIDELYPHLAFQGFTEYRIESRAGDLLNLQPVLRSADMPELPRVPVFPGIPGCSQTPPLGSRVAVGFLNSDPARPFVAGFEDGAASSGLELITDGIGAAGHAITLEQVMVLFGNFLCALVAQSATDTTVFKPNFIATPSSGPTMVATILQSMLTGAIAPTACGLSGAPGGVIGGIPAAPFPAPGAFASAIASALASQLPDPASAGIPFPEFPGVAKKNLRL